MRRSSSGRTGQEAAQRGRSAPLGERSGPRDGDAGPKATAAKATAGLSCKPPRDLPFLPDESSWLQDPNNVRGLRSVSVRMCHLLRQKQTCTCNEVADQLTEESQAAATRERDDTKTESSSPVPEKNLRRRIYDALNVLASAGVVEKDGEVVHWRGLPDHIEVSALQAEKRQRQVSIANKKRLAAEIQEKQAAFEILLQRNRDPGFAQQHEQSARLAMPFVSIIADRRTQIDQVETTPRGSSSTSDTTATGNAATKPAATTAQSTPQKGSRRTTRSASAPLPAALQADARSTTAAAPTMVYEVADNFCLHDDADILRQMLRTGALKRRRLGLNESER